MTQHSFGIILCHQSTSCEHGIDEGSMGQMGYMYTRSTMHVYLKKNCVAQNCYLRTLCVGQGELNIKLVVHVATETLSITKTKHRCSYTVPSLSEYRL